MGSVFISYRRTDSTPYAVSLATALRKALGSKNVFLDTTGIELGEPYPARLAAEIERARVCLIVIGPEWLKTPDQNGRRRIDDPNDWVHSEVRYALEHDKAVPVLVHGAKMPPPDALPAPLQALSFAKGGTLLDDRMVEDLRDIVAFISRKFALPLFEPDIVWPQPDEEVKRAGALSEPELSSWLASRRAEAKWSLVPWQREAGSTEDGTALLRTYRFRSFEDAMHFMATAARFVTIKEHHPAWSNVWRTVTVRLTTFDIGHRPSVFDLQLAEYLDDLYRQYEPEARVSPGHPSGPKPTEAV